MGAGCCSESGAASPADATGSSPRLRSSRSSSSSRIQDSDPCDRRQKSAVADIDAAVNRPRGLALANRGQEGPRGRIQPHPASTQVGRSLPDRQRAENLRASELSRRTRLGMVAKASDLLVTLSDSQDKALIWVYT